MKERNFSAGAYRKGEVALSQGDQWYVLVPFLYQRAICHKGKIPFYCKGRYHLSYIARISPNLDMLFDALSCTVYAICIKIVHVL